MELCRARLNTHRRRTGTHTCQLGRTNTVSISLHWASWSWHWTLLLQVPGWVSTGFPILKLLIEPNMGKQGSISQPPALYTDTLPLGHPGDGGPGNGTCNHVCRPRREQTELLRHPALLNSFLAISGKFSVMIGTLFSMFSVHVNVILNLHVNARTCARVRVCLRACMCMIHTTQLQLNATIKNSLNLPSKQMCQR